MMLTPTAATASTALAFDCTGAKVLPLIVTPVDAQLRAKLYSGSPFGGYAPFKTARRRTATHGCQLRSWQPPKQQALNLPMSASIVKLLPPVGHGFNVYGSGCRYSCLRLLA